MGESQSFGDSDVPINDWALSHVAALIAEVQPGSMVQKFVLLVEVIDEEDRWLSAFTAPGQKAWDSMGLLQYGLNLENSVRLDTDD